MNEEELAALEEAMADLEEQMQAEADAIAEYDARNADRSMEFEPRSAYV